jgi:hypothetical protein
MVLGLGDAEPELDARLLLLAARCLLANLPPPFFWCVAFFDGVGFVRVGVGGVDTGGFAFSSREIT